MQGEGVFLKNLSTEKGQTLFKTRFSPLKRLLVKDDFVNNRLYLSNLLKNRSLIHSNKGIFEYQH